MGSAARLLAGSLPAEERLLQPVARLSLRDPSLRAWGRSLRRASCGPRDAGNGAYRLRSPARASFASVVMVRYALHASETRSAAAKWPTSPRLIMPTIRLLLLITGSLRTFSVSM